MARPYNSFVRIREGVYRFTRAGSGDIGSNASENGIKSNVTIIGGVHGNERIGVEVLDKLRLGLMQVSPSLKLDMALPVVREGASVTLVYGNLQAQRTGQRGSGPHADLNRCFSVDLLSRSSIPTTTESYEEKRACELAPILEKSDVMVDLHSTNKPSEPFVRIAGYPQGIPSRLQHMVGRLPCDILLHDPQYLIGEGKVALTDEFVGACGGMGLCFESGIASDLSETKIDRITRSVLQILQEDTQAIEFLDHSSSEKVVSTYDIRMPSMVYEITEVFKLTTHGFRWAERVGDENFQRIQAGEPIGYIGQGEETTPFVVDYDAFIVFPKIPSLWKIGS